MSASIWLRSPGAGNLRVSGSASAAQTNTAKLIAATATLAGFLVAHGSDGDLGEARTMATIVLYIVATWVLTILARPLNWWRTLMIAALIAS